MRRLVVLLLVLGYVSQGNGMAQRPRQLNTKVELLDFDGKESVVATATTTLPKNCGTAPNLTVCVC
ncbi:MAG: hypothetical protein AB7F88_00480 [Pyrinomonadaceae bacterium]